MTATMTDESATAQTPKIITKADLILRAKHCASHDQWNAIKSRWKREEILMAADDEVVPHPEHLMRALDSVESLIEAESNKALFNERREELIKRAESCTDSPFWEPLIKDRENFKTRLVLRVSGENFGPRDVVDAIHALDVVERKLLDMQERVNARVLRGMGVSDKPQPPSHGGKGNRQKHKHR